MNFTIRVKWASHCCSTPNEQISVTIIIWNENTTKHVGLVHRRNVTWAIYAIAENVFTCSLGIKQQSRSIISYFKFCKYTFILSFWIRCYFGSHDKGIRFTTFITTNQRVPTWAILDSVYLPIRTYIRYCKTSTLKQVHFARNGNPPTYVTLRNNRSNYQLLNRPLPTVFL